MSTAESLNRPPLEEIAKRVSEGATGLATAAHAVAVRNYAVSQGDYRHRINDSHRAGMKAIGLNRDELSASDAEDEMGDIIVTGDVYGDRAIAGLQRQSPPDREAPSSRTLPSLIVAASLLVGGAGLGVLVADWLLPDPPAAVDTDTATDVTFPE